MTCHSLNYMLKNIKKHPFIFENRASKYKFGVKNYGEIPHHINKADGDPWDIFAPGYNSSFKTNTPFMVDKVIGILLLKDGNHKLAIRIKGYPILSNHFEHYNSLKYSRN